MTRAAARELKPQPGPQTKFFQSSADIVIYGGGAGGGKSWALLVEPLRHIHNKKFGAVIFRRERTQVFNEGGLWDEASDLYPDLGARSNRNDGTWTFPGGASVSFAHLQHENDIYAHQGAQIPLAEFDELTHFTAKQFWYIVGRNRSTCGVRPYIRASTNPDADSWVADLIAWWIDQDELLPDGTPNPSYGQPIPERAGVIRWFIRDGGVLHWGATPEEVAARFPPGQYAPGDAKSLTFIPASLTDNRILMERDPGYRANLLAQDPVERARLLGGNWKARAASGLYFRRGWTPVVDVVPIEARRIRYWDRAATEPTQANPDPDWTVGVLMAITPDGLTYIEDVVRLRGTPGMVKNTILATAEADFAKYGFHVTIGIEQDPGSAGKSEGHDYLQLLSRFPVRLYPVSKKGAKVVRFGPFSAQAEAKNVRVKRAEWNSVYFSMLEAFPTPGVHDDDVDATSGAYNALQQQPPTDKAATAAAEATVTPPDPEEGGEYDPWT